MNQMKSTNSQTTRIVTVLLLIVTLVVLFIYFARMRSIADLSSQFTDKSYKPCTLGDGQREVNTYNTYSRPAIEGIKGKLGHCKMSVPIFGRYNTTIHFSSVHGRHPYL